MVEKSGAVKGGELLYRHDALPGGLKKNGNKYF